MTKRYMALYGSLREGMYNFNAFQRMYGKESLNVIKKGVKLDNYKMFSLGAYPFCIEADDSSILVDLVEVTSERAATSIDGMELGAGYAMKEIEIDGHPATIYLYPKDRDYSNRTTVPSGDWVKFKTEDEQK